MADNQFSVRVPNVLEALMAGEQSYDKSRGYAVQRQQDAARQEASTALSSGDPNASRNALAKLLGVGDIQGANALANFGNQTATQDYQRGMLGVAQQNASTTAAAAKNVTPTTITVGAADGRKQTAIFDPATRTTTPLGAPMGEEQKPLTAGDRKAIFESEDELANLKSTRDALARAKELAPKAFVGAGSELRATLGNNLASIGMTSTHIAPPDKAAATTELGQLLSAEAITSMSKTLKGASTDREMMEFKNLTANPNVPVEIKLKAIDRMMAKVDLQEKINTDRMNQLRNRDYFKPTGGQSAPGSGTSQGAQPQIKEGATATNPQTGQKAVFQGGQWVPVQ